MQGSKEIVWSFVRSLELWKTFLFSVWNFVARKLLKMPHELQLVFSSAWLLSKKSSWLNAFSDLIGSYALSSKIFLYKSYILFQSSVHFLTLRLKLSFQLKDPVLLHRILNTFFVAVLKSILKKWKEKSSDAVCTVLYGAFRQIHVSEAQFACIPSKD